jgi:hypothetical protein
MVQIVENWAVLEGQVEGWQPASAGTRAILTLRVSRVTPVERSAGSFYPNFLEGREGASVQVVLPETTGGPMATGDRVRVRVRRGQQPDQFFAHPEGVTALTR